MYKIYNIYIYRNNNILSDVLSCEYIRQLSNIYLGLIGMALL